MIYPGEGMDDLITIVHQAGKIARLEAEVERLRKALTKIAQDGVVREGEPDWDVCTLGCWWTAKQALKGEDWYLDE